MTKRRVFLVLILLFGAGGSAAAQDAPKVDIFAGYALTRNGDLATFLRGYHASVAAYVDRNFLDPVALMGEFSGHHKRDATSSLRLNTFTFGPRCYFGMTEKDTIFGHTTFGVARLTTKSLDILRTQTSFAFTFGGGWDYAISRRVAWRVIQVDYLMTHFGSEFQNGGRYSTGLVLYLGRK